MRLAVLTTFFAALRRSYGQLACRVFCYGRAVVSLLVVGLCLSGCVRYNVDIAFNDTNHGEIVQTIQLDKQLTAFSRLTAEEWLNGIERRAQQLQGRAERVSPEELIVRIPFYSGPDLASKFNQFFIPPRSDDTGGEANPDQPELISHLDVSQDNYLFAVRNRLSYDLDLRVLNVLSADDSRLVSPDSVLDLKFELQTPWGARKIRSADRALNPDVRSQGGRQLIWQLQAGDFNHIEVVFWLPNLLGIGTAVIIVLVISGIYLRHTLLPKDMQGELNQQ